MPVSLAVAGGLSVDAGAALGASAGVSAGKHSADADVAAGAEVGAGVGKSGKSAAVVADAELGAGVGLSKRDKAAAVGAAAGVGAAADADLHKHGASLAAVADLGAGAGLNLGHGKGKGDDTAAPSAEVGLQAALGADVEADMSKHHKLPISNASLVSQLEAKGFVAVGNIRKLGNLIHCDAVKDGSLVRLTLDARTGAIVAVN
jgi:hypothetical protein